MIQIGIGLSIDVTMTSTSNMASSQSGRARGWAWELFYTDNTNYKFDHPYKNAWCFAEFKFEVEIFHQSNIDGI